MNSNWKSIFSGTTGLKGHLRRDELLFVRSATRHIRLFTVLLAAGIGLPLAANAQSADMAEEHWRRQALHHINRIEDEETLGRALYEFTPVRLWAGDVEGASADASRITNPQLCGYAHYQIARYRKAAGDMDGAVEELRAAEESAMARGYTYSHVDACLDIAESLDMAKSYVSRVLTRNPREATYGHSSLVAALAKRGMLQEALEITGRIKQQARPRALSRIAQETANRADVANAQMLLARLTKQGDKDAVLLNLIRALKQRGQTRDALQFVADIKDPATRHSAKHLTNQLAGKPIKDLTIDELKQQIADEKSAEVRQQLYQTLLSMHLKAQDVDGANATINAMVQLIETAGFAETESKFGNTTNAARIAMARLNYLHIAKIHAQRNEKEKGMIALQRAENAMNEMPDSSGMAKMMSVPGVLATQIEFGEFDAVKESVKTLRPVFWQQQAPFLAETFLNNGDAEMGMFVARTILSGKGAGGAEIISSFIHADQITLARELLDHVDVDSPVGHAACRLAGATLIGSSRTSILNDWLEELPPAICAHLCIGASRVAGSALMPAANEIEREVIAFITIGDELPEQFRLKPQGHPNPGFYRRSALPILARGLQHHRSGPPPQILNAAKSTFESDKHGELSVQIYQLDDAKTAQRLLSEMYVEPFASRYLQKGPFIVFVSTSYSTEQNAAGDHIQCILNGRDLPAPE